MEKLGVVIIITGSLWGLFGLARSWGGYMSQETTAGIAIGSLVVIALGAILYTLATWHN